MNSQLKVSVIIPVYNAELYLHQCLDSILNQTLKEFEVICVDDGSTDTSLSILREYEAKDSRIKIICQKNQYAGVARNAGIKIAKGKYFVFLDSDDFFEPELLEVQYNQCEKYQAEIGLCAADVYNNAEKKYSPAPWLLNEKLIKIQPFSRKTLGNSIFELTKFNPWTKMFLASFVRNNELEFQATPRANDLYFVMSAILLANSIVAENRVLVHYRTGITTNLQSNNSRSPLDPCEALYLAKQMLVKHGVFDEIYDGFSVHAMEHCLYNLRRVSTNQESYNTLRNALRKKYLGEFGITMERKAIFKKNDFDSICEQCRLNTTMTKKESEISVSVLIAVYNVEQYLRECMDSLIAQTLENIEIICVNDGSTDNSLAVLKEYAAKDSRITIIDKKNNEGLLLARKSGVLASNGKYIMFVDSDDFLASDACEQALSLIENHKVDILQFTCGVEDNSGKEDVKRWLENALTPKPASLTNDEILDDFFVTRRHNTNIWGKIYTSEICKKVYDHIENFHCFVGEDIFQFFYYAYFANTYVAVKTAPLYFYRYGLGVGNSAAMKLSKFELYCKMGNLHNKVKDFLINRSEYNKYYNQCCCMGKRMLEDCCNIFKGDRISFEEKDEAKALLIKYWKSFEEGKELLEKTIDISIEDFFKEKRDVVVYSKNSTTDKNTAPKISVIIPVYNVEQYLVECLDSILNQTFKDIEIICVNDGSTDTSLNILKDYIEKDNRIIIISQQNHGLSASRNIALKHARGKYVYMIDSDDYLRLDALEKLYNTCETKNLDLLFFDNVRFYDMGDGKTEEAEQLVRKEYSGVYDGVTFIKTLKDDKAYLTSACLVFLRNDLLTDNNISFYEGIIHEDELFCFHILMNASRVSHTSDKFYYRRLRPGSIMTSTVSHKNVIGYFITMEEIMRYGLDANLTGQKLAEVWRAFEGMRWGSRTRFAKLPEEERKKISFENPFIQLLFDVFISTAVLPEPSKSTTAQASVVQNTNNNKKANNDAEKYLWTYQQQVKSLETEIRNMVNSATYKIGRFITWLPRKIRGGFRCLREHGFKYTFSRLLLKLGLKKPSPFDVPSVPGKPKRGDNYYYRTLPVDQYEKELEYWYKHKTGKKLHLNNPKTFNEKLQWMKLYDSTPLKTRLADKYLMRDWVKEKIGEEYLIPLLGVWDNFDEIDFDKLPNQFALKTNHSSGWNIIVKDKSKLDLIDAKQKFDRWMRINFAFFGFEMHYMNIPPKIIAEQYIQNAEGLIDYRFYCFNGKPTQVWVDIFSGTPQHLRSIFDMNWKPIKMKCTWPEGGTLLSQKPKNFEKMKEFATLLSQEFAFVRVDFFEVDGKLYMGEMTFTPMTGTGKFQPSRWDMKLGKLLKLPPKSPIPDKNF